MLSRLLAICCLCKMLMMTHDLFRHQNVPGLVHKGNYCFVYPVKTSISRNALAFYCVCKEAHLPGGAIKFPCPVIVLVV